jgi:hypothetical protein
VDRDPAGGGHVAPARLMTRTAVAFSALAIGLSWAVWLPIAWSGIDSSLKAVGSFGPAVAALTVVVARPDLRDDWRSRLTAWRVPIRWYALVLIGPVIVCGVVVAAARVIGLTDLRFNDPSQIYLIVPAFVAVLVLGGPLGEEPGWRGLLLPTLAERMPFPIAGLVVGLVWAAWHLPLFLIPGTPQADLPIAGYVALTAALGVVYGSLAQHTRGSVPVAIVFHTASNTGAGLLPILPPDTGGSVAPFLALTGLVVLVAAVLLGRSVAQHLPSARRLRSVRS